MNYFLITSIGLCNDNLKSLQEPQMDYSITALSNSQRGSSWGEDLILGRLTTGSKPVSPKKVMILIFIQKALFINNKYMIKKKDNYFK